MMSEIPQPTFIDCTFDPHSTVSSIIERIASIYSNKVEFGSVECEYQEKDGMMTISRFTRGTRDQ